METTPVKITSATAYLKKGWKLFNERAWFYAGATALIMLFVILVNAILGSFDSFIAQVLLYIVTIWISVGIVRFYLNATGGTEKKAEIKDYFSEYRPMIWLRFFITSLITGVIVFFGFILLIVPGVYLAMRFSQIKYAIVDKNETIFGSIKLSWAMTKGNAWKIFVLAFLSALIMILGFILLGIGLLVAIPVVTLAFASLYRELAGETNAVVTPEAATIA